jgi:hypothetical protein
MAKATSVGYSLEFGGDGYCVEVDEVDGDEVRFLMRGYVKAKGEKLPPCPLCGKKSRARWTMLCPFRAHDFGCHEVQKGIVLEPLTLVCSDYLISPTAEICKAL